MANGIKLGSLDISAFKVGSGDCKVYLGDTLLYPTFQGKWLATYTGGTTSSAECGASSAITSNEITKTNLVSVKLGQCVTSIGDDAFYNCTTLSSVTLNNNITSIGNQTFSNCTGLTSVTIPNSVTSIGDEAFRYDFSLTNLILSESLVSLGTRVFGACSGLTTIDIPDSLTDTGQHTFNQCTNLATVNFSPTSRLTTIGYASFANIPAMVHFDIPSTVTTIGGRAFRNNTSLEEIVIPSSVTSIGEYTFDGCSSFTSVTVNAVAPPTLGNSAFDNSSCPIYVPSESVDAYKSAWSTYASRIQAIPTPSLPSGYTEVEYIQNTGYSYINTNFVPNQDSRIVADMQMVTETQYPRLWGAGAWDRDNGLNLNYQDGNLNISWFGISDWTGIYSISTNYDRHVYDVNKNELYVDETLVGSSTYTSMTASDNLAIFTFIYLGNEGDFREFFKGKMYSFQVYDNGTLVRDLVPCVRNNDSVVGAYDIVNQVFYTSANSNYPLVGGNPV